MWCIFDQQHRSGIHHCRNPSIVLGRSIDILCTSSSPVRHMPTSSSYVIIILRHHPTSSAPFLTESDLCIQGRDKKLITIGNKPVFVQSLILTSDQQVLISQASVN
jgi:hypothetical protein